MARTDTMKRTAVAVLGALLVGSPAAASIVETSPDHFVTRDSVTVKAAPKATWLELISPNEWWDDDHTWSGKAANLSIVPQGGGCFCERLPAKESANEIGLAGSAQHMTVLMAEPMTVLRMRGALGPLQSEPVDGVLTITLQAVPEGTRIVWEYVVAGHMRYDVDKISRSVDKVMSQQLAHLADKLGRVQPAENGSAGQAVPAGPQTSEGGNDGILPSKAGDGVGEALDAMGRSSADDPGR